MNLLGAEIVSRSPIRTCKQLLNMTVNQKSDLDITLKRPFNVDNESIKP